MTRQKTKIGKSKKHFSKSGSISHQNKGYQNSGEKLKRFMVVTALRCFDFEASVELPLARVKSSHDTLAPSPSGRNCVFFINVFVFDPLVELPPSRCLYLFSFQVNDDVFGVKR